MCKDHEAVRQAWAGTDKDILQLQALSSLGCCMSAALVALKEVGLGTE